MEDVYFEHTELPTLGRDCFYSDYLSVVTTFHFKTQDVADAFIESGCYNPDYAEFVVD